MNNVRDILRSKESREVRTIRPLASVYEGIGLLSGYDISALLVVEGYQVIGIFSEKELTRNVLLGEKDSRTTKIYEVMERSILTVDLSTTVDECMQTMTTHRKRHLPVIQDGTLIGIVSIGDVVKAKIDYQASLIDQLQDYICS